MGKRVLGIDRFHPPHTLGSSHGQTRIIREAYFEHPSYVPLIQRAYQLWSELDGKSGRQLFQQTGGLMIGAPGSQVFEGARHSAEQHGLAHQILSAPDVTRRFPALRPGPGMMAVWEPRAGILFPELCITAHLQLAQQAGATFRFDETAAVWSVADGKVVVRTGAGVFEGTHLVISAGAWIASLVPGLAAILSVERQIQFWFQTAQRAKNFLPANCPVHLWESAPGKYFYGFPDLGEGVKVARHHEGNVTTPDSVPRAVHPDEVEAMRQLVRQFLPDADGPLRASAVCCYTNTPDGHFLIDHLPKHPNVVIASPCSGHGFKFSSVIGETIARRVTGQSVPFDLSLFRWRKSAGG